MIRFGGVPEHFNVPWRDVIGGRIDASWREVPGGSGAMAQMLRDSELDAAIMLTEGAVGAIAGGVPVRIVGTHVDSPLRWGIHVRSGAPISEVGALRGARVAISRYGSGSHLIPMVFWRERGWPTDELEFVEVGDLHGGLAALVEGRADVFFWEQFMTQPHVDSGELACIDVFMPPWPSFVVVAAQSALDHDELAALIEAVGARCRELAADPATPAALSDEFGMSAADAARWLQLIRWTCSRSVSAEALARASEALRALGEDVPPVEELVDERLAVLG